MPLPVLLANGQYRHPDEEGDRPQEEEPERDLLGGAHRTYVIPRKLAKALNRIPRIRATRFSSARGIKMCSARTSGSY